ncbi:MAG: PQQ-binding-like beta-propeller repeat protein [Bacteriovoracaceae bacterium]
MRIVLLSLLFIVGCGQMRPHAPLQEKKILSVVWSKNLDSNYVSGNLPIGVGAPRIFQDIVYMGSMDGVMSAYDLESGRTLWSIKEKSELGAPAEFFNDHIAYGGLSGRLYVRHYLTGKLKYAIDLSAPIESAPVYFNGRLIIYLRGHQIAYLDAETGKILWVYKRAVPVTTTLQRTTKPLFLGNKVILGFADGYIGALSTDEGLLVWETKIVETSKFVDVDINPTLVGGVIVTGSPSGELKAINPDNGAIAQSYGVSVMSHPVVRGDQLILGSNDGEVLLMNVGGEVLKKVKISKAPVSALAWWKGNIVAASFDGKLRVVDPLSMKVLDEFALGYEYSSVFSDLVVSEDYLAVYSSRNRLYVFH